MHEYPKTSERSSLPAGLVSATAATTVATVGVGTAKAAEDSYADPGLPSPEMTLNLERTALVVIDPQIDVLSPKGAAWPVLGEGVIEHKAVQNLARLLKASKRAGITIAISLTSEGFRDSGSDFLPDLTQYIEDGETIICLPHKLYSPLPRVNDIGLQIRKRRVDQIILAGMIANLHIEFHLRDFLEQGFEVAVVRDAIAGPKLPEGDGYLSALIKFRCIANALWTTEETVKRLG